MMRRKNRVKAKVEAERRTTGGDKSLENTVRWLGLVFCFIVIVIMMLTALDFFDEKAVLGDGHSINTRPLQQRVDHAKPGDELVIEKGRHITGPVTITTSNITIIIKGTLVAIPDATHYKEIAQFPSYPSGTRYQSLLTIANCSDVTIKGDGGGIIDGNGKYWWDRMKRLQTDQPNRPRLVEIINSRGTTLKNLFLKDSPFWNVHVIYSNNVTVSDLVIHAPDDSPNTDGVVPDSSSNIIISNNAISVGDDAIAIKSGKDAEGIAYAKPCHDVKISHNILLSGHGVSIGSEVSGGISDIDFYNNTILGPMKRAFRIKTNPSRGGYISDVNVISTKISEVDKFIEITTSYHSKGAPADIPTKISGIIFDGVRRIKEGKNPSKEIQPGSLICTSSIPCTDIVFKDVNLEPYSGAMKCEHASECL